MTAIDEAIDPNVERIRARLLDRARLGAQKYGVTTAGADLSHAEWLRHLQEEMLDAAVYVEAALNRSDETSPCKSPDRDAYEGAREELLDWKGRAQRAETRLRAVGYQGVDASEPPAPREAAQEPMSWSTSKPTVPGAYWVRGYCVGSREDKALVEVRFVSDKLCCNLHCINSDNDDELSPLETYSPKFEWFGPLHPAPQQREGASESIPLSSLLELLPGAYYMDPPDGGRIPVLEQLRRMASDAARYRALREAPIYEPWGVPRIAIPKSASAGDFVSGDDADAAVDEIVAKRLAGKSA